MIEIFRPPATGSCGSWLYAHFLHERFGKERMSWYSLYRKVRRQPFVIGIGAAAAVCAFPSRVTDIAQKIEVIGWPRTLLDAGRLSVTIIGLILLVFGLLDWLKRALRRRVLLHSVAIILVLALLLGACISAYFAWPYLGHMPILYLLPLMLLILAFQVSQLLFIYAFRTPRMMSELPLFDWADQCRAREAREREYEAAEQRRRADAARDQVIDLPRYYDGGTRGRCLLV